MFNLIPQNPNPHLFNSKEKLKYDSKSNERNLKQITIHLQIKNNENEQILCKSKIDYSSRFLECLSCSNGKIIFPNYSLSFQLSNELSQARFGFINLKILLLEVKAQQPLIFCGSNLGRRIKEIDGRDQILWDMESSRKI